MQAERIGRRAAETQQESQNSGRTQVSCTQEERQWQKFTQNVRQRYSNSHLWQAGRVHLFQVDLSEESAGAESQAGRPQRQRMQEAGGPGGRVPERQSTVVSSRYPVRT